MDFHTIIAENLCDSLDNMRADTLARWGEENFEVLKASQNLVLREMARQYQEGVEDVIENLEYQVRRGYSSCGDCMRLGNIQDDMLAQASVKWESENKKFLNFLAVAFGEKFPNLAEYKESEEILVEVGKIDSILRDIAEGYKIAV